MADPDPVACGSCGRLADPAELTQVHRAYFFDADDPEPAVVEEPERWCTSCVATYPHVRVDDG